MVTTALTLSDDQAEAWDAVSDLLGDAGVDMLGGATMAPKDDPVRSVLAVLGKAGSGKTLLLAELFKSLKEAGVDIVSGDYEGKKRRDPPHPRDPCPHQQGGIGVAQPRRARHHDPPDFVHADV